MQKSRCEATELVERLNQKGGVYHRLDLGDGLVLEGQYDMRPLLDHYRFPQDLSGCKVLDVGTATGFFALEFAKRGGEVTAIDIWEYHFLPVLSRAIGVEVEYVQKDLYDLDPSFGQFDLVFCGSLLLHVWDQFNALRRMRSVCRDLFVIATDMMPRRRFSWRKDKALAELIAARGESDAGEHWATWRPNATALAGLMVAAGFHRVSQKGSFVLHPTPGYHDFKVFHGVFHGFAKER